VGLRDRTTSRVRDRDLRLAQTGGVRILVGRAMGEVRRFGAYLIMKAKAISMPDMTREEEIAADRSEHFAETMLGGIAITFALLVGIMLLLWIGSLF
jgi:hypothetical protein